MHRRISGRNRGKLNTLVFTIIFVILLALNTFIFEIKQNEAKTESNWNFLIYTETKKLYIP